MFVLPQQHAGYLNIHVIGIANANFRPNYDPFPTDANGGLNTNENSPNIRTRQTFSPGEIFLFLKPDSHFLRNHYLIGSQYTLDPVHAVHQK
jgi:hypothetical protein